MEIAIVYGSNGGATEEVAEKIKNALELENIHLVDICDGVDGLDDYSKMIIGTSTWGEGDLQDDWDNAFDEFKGLEFGGKTIAFFGLGDQDGYPDNFLDAMGTLYNVVIDNGGSVVGDSWSIDGYDFDESTAVNENGFVGLAIDEDNQDDLTDDRVTKWIKIIKPHFK